ncbi:hypothetical protein LguiB_009021 [Lonicera macranthoides]
MEIPSKFLYSSTDEKPDMQKQLGCMNGIFQLFDRHHFLSGRRVQNPKKQSPGQNANQAMELSSAADKTPAQQKNLKEVEKEKQRVPVESSRTSFSSCSSSTFDCKTSQPETSSLTQSICPETPPSFLPIKQPNSSSNVGPAFLELRDIVKDSMYREARGVSVKTTGKEERKGHVMKHIDSPRPMLPSKSFQHKFTADDGSVQVLSKLRWNSKEERSSSLPLAGPRFSYDERESRHKLKSNVKLRELPRLSLDSRERSIRKSASESRSNYLSRGIQGKNENNSSVILNDNREPGSNKRPSTIVAKLMGLEDLPDSISSDEVKSRGEEFDTVPRLSRAADGRKQSQIFGSPRVSIKDPASTHLGKANYVMKPISSSRFPLEPAPWSQFKNTEVPTKIQNVQPSVYGEIEKRLTKIEFKKSGKDLRALKQILEAMQKTRERLEPKKEEESSTVESQISQRNPNYSSFDRGSNLPTKQCQQINHPISPTIKGMRSPKRYGSAIVIMKPTKLVEKPSDYSVIPAKDKKTKARTLRSSPSSKVPQYIGESPASFRRISGTVTPTLQQRKQGMEKQSQLTSPSSDLSRGRRQSSKQSMDTARKPKSKSTTLSHQVDTASVQSDSNISLASQVDTEITSIYQTNATNGTTKDKVSVAANCVFVCIAITTGKQVSSFFVQNFAARLSEDRSMAELAITTLEQPSPVSVLDATFYGEDSPSPVKKISYAFKDDETLYCDEAQLNGADIDQLQGSTRTNLNSKFNNNKPGDFTQSVHKHRLVNYPSEEATTSEIALLCESTTPDHRYIAEILLASGLLKDLGSTITAMQLHPSAHFINPDLFHILEKIKSNDERHEKIARSKYNAKIKRKLVFDTVNEILVRKLVLPGSWIFQNKLVGRVPRVEKLLSELCSEIDHLHANQSCSADDEDDGFTSILSADMMNNQSDNWANYRGEVPGLVLDIERLIFKDLISEIVSGGRGKHIRELFL